MTREKGALASFVEDLQAGGMSSRPTVQSLYQAGSYAAVIEAVGESRDLELGFLRAASLHALARYVEARDAYRELRTRVQDRVDGLDASARMYARQAAEFGPYDLDNDPELVEAQNQAYFARRDADEARRLLQKVLEALEALDRGDSLPRDARR